MSKRRFFQLHLSTAVVLMLVAGVLVWANVRKKHWEMKKANPPELIIGAKSGWPFVSRQEIWSSLYSGPVNSHRGIWTIRRAIYNALITLAILLAVWQLCEWRIRRKQMNSIES